MRVGDLVQAVKSIQKLDALSLPIDIAFDLCQLIDELQLHLTTFDKCKLKLLEKYGIPNKDNHSSYDIPKENIQAINEALELLYNKEIQVSISVSIKLSILNDDTLKMSADDIRLTKPFINYIRE